jgi:hypothetical protein
VVNRPAAAIRLDRPDPDDAPRSTRQVPGGV